jgi:membrane protein YqaA with SNARE-associated domain
LLARITSALVAYGPLGVFLIGLIDSIGVPLPATMDALIILIAVKAPQRAYLAASMGVLGSIGGNVALFEMARFGVRRFVREVESGGKSSRLRNWFHRYGLITVFIPAAVPILPLPLKFFVVSAGVFRMARVRFLLVILVSRALRYFGDAFLGVKLGADAQGFLHRNAWTLTAIAVGMALVLLGLIRWADRRGQPAG